MRHSRFVLFVIAIALPLTGCSKPPPPQKLPRPVSVIALTEFDPGGVDRITGSVASWKTEEIGFEVSGRVQFVIEPEINIQGRTFDAGGKPLTEGTMLARLDDTRYRLHVKNVAAQITATTKKKEALAIETNQVIPAQKRAAEADYAFAKGEFERLDALYKSNRTVSQSDRDKALANRDSAEAQVAQIEASRTAKASELLALDAQIEELQESLADAQRDVDECRLVSPFAGQIAAVHVIPGAYVDRGRPVLTVQMMDPIKVEFEVSAATARRLNYGDNVPIQVSLEDGSTRGLDGNLYMLDPVADPLTRTFTVTVLFRNEKIRQTAGDEPAQPLARTNRIGRIHQGLEGWLSGYFVNVEAIHEDAQGSYVWKILNRQVGTPASETDKLLKVKKVRVTPGELRVPFLGIWTFSQVTLVDNEFDPETDLIADNLTLPPGATEQWDGDTILYDRERWLLRPGDLVGVDLSGRPSQSGIYVPLDAIREKSGQHFVFAVSADGGAEPTAQRVAVRLLETVDTLARIEPEGDAPLATGTLVIDKGVHYVQDGEPVRVVGEPARLRR